MAETGPYYVIERNGWSYVEGRTTPKDSGPWRYRHEAQDYADEMNVAAPAAPQGEQR